MNRPSEVIKELAHYLSDNDSFVDLVNGFANCPEDVYFEIDVDKLTKAIAEFYKTVKG